MITIKDRRMVEIHHLTNAIFKLPTKFWMNRRASKLQIASNVSCFAYIISFNKY